MIANNSNEFVGVVESVRGMAALVAAIPLGYAADVMRRSSMLLLTVLCGPIIALMMALAVHTSNKILVVFSVACWAISLQAFSGTMTAMLADLATGPTMAKVMAWQTMVIQVGNASGPLVQLCLLLVVGSSGWSLPLLKMSVIAGLLPVFIMIPIAFSLRRFELQEQNERSLSSPVVASTTTINDQMPEWAQNKLMGGRCQVMWIAVVIIELSFVAVLLVAGCSVKYFGLFFRQDFQFGPVALCSLSASFPIVVAAMVPGCVRLANSLGRIPGIIVMTVAGGLFQVLFGRSITPTMAVVMFYLRHGFMKSRDPLYQAMLMDCLPKRYRGRFGAITSLRSVSWSGSAWIGGLILDHTGSNYRELFEFSGLTICMSSVIVSPLLCLVPRRETPRAALQQTC